MKKYLIIGVSLAFIIALILLLRGDEDTWVKADTGLWVKHGNPKQTPSEVAGQQELINKAIKQIQLEKKAEVDLSDGPCLGVISPDWVLDIAHKPRTSIDNSPENQCDDYVNGKVHHFIEMDELGNVLRIN